MRRGFNYQDMANALRPELAAKLNRSRPAGAASDQTKASSKPVSSAQQSGIERAPSGLSAGESPVSDAARPTARPGSTTFKLTLYPIPDGPDGIGRMPVDRLRGALNLLQCGFGLRASFVTEIAHGGTENEDDDD